VAALFAPTLHAQQYDFDSLYHASEEFRNQIKVMQDTLDIFNQDQALGITLETDFVNLSKRKHNKEDQEAMLTYGFNDTVQVTRKIKVQPRGNFRLKNCHNPPLQLNLPKKEAAFKQFEEFDKIKMVGNCKNYKTFEQYILAEYLVYKTYNLLTAYSFRVRLLKVHYIDSKGNDNRKPQGTYAFLIEPEKQLARRLEGVLIDRQNLSPHGMDAEATLLMDVFQYMIGNTDWAVEALHNIKLVKSNDVSKPTPSPVPYDFDYSGLVNTSYAKPAEALSIKTVRERLFRGVCHRREEYEHAFELFRQKRDAIYQLYQNFELLDPLYKAQILNYLDAFYQIIDAPASVEQQFLGNCRKQNSP
jgi:hypothetical protein